MIQLIASDMDGTLLPPYTSQVSDRAKDLIDRLIHNGILFCPASGRQYANLKMLFDPLGDRIPYICENGAAVILRGEVIAQAPMDQAAAEELLADINGQDGYELQVNVVRTCYLTPKTESYLRLMRDQVRNHVTVVNDIFSITQEPILKISVYCEEGITEDYLRWIQGKYGQIFQVLQSSAKFIDATAKGINKGWGMEKLADHLAIPTEDIVAIGDHNNDREILELVGPSVVMKSRVPSLQKLAEQTIDTVEDYLAALLTQVEAGEI